MTQTLHGRTDREGFCVSWHEHDGASAAAMDGESSRVSLCLNLDGNAVIRAGRRRGQVTQRTASHLVGETRACHLQRVSGETHRYLTIDLSRPYLTGRVGGSVGELHPAVREWLGGRTPRSVPFGVMPMSLAMESMAREMRESPWPGGAAGLWYESRVLDLMARVLFVPQPAPGQLFCEQHKRRVTDGVMQVKQLILENLEHPRSLTELAAAVGWNPFFLCRTFSREAGVSLSRFVRRSRMEHAAALLRDGRHNVTEAAMAVGYSSLSHFSKAFAQDMGCCPCTWRLTRR